MRSLYNCLKRPSLRYFLVSAVFLLGSIRLTAQQELTGIRVGGKVPDIALTGLRNYSSPDIKLSEFRGKLLIIDFWASWCSPCLSMIPKIDSLQKEFTGKVQFLAVTYEKESVAKPFAERMRKRVPSPVPELYEDKALHNLFPHRELPHYVWIDGAGTVLAITGFTDVNKNNIEKMLTGAPGLRTKRDYYTKYDRSKPLFIENNGGGGSTVIGRSLLAGFIPGLNSGSSAPDKLHDTLPFLKITCRNTTIPKLFELAYGEGKIMHARVMLNVKDSARVKFPESADAAVKEKWVAENAYCYELWGPKNTAGYGFELMRQDLNRYFPDYSAKMEKRSVTCLALVRTSKEDKLTTKGEEPAVTADRFGCTLTNTFLSHLITRLDFYYLQNLPYPIVNDTGFTGRVDLKINGNLGNLEAVNRELAKYDVTFTKKELEIDVLVISDKN
ncbi:TlpA family protein disulfide reductase [Hufsiella ginkgonis]|uniref:Redoxin domain-containing protein n=1 Tax=Hufsiella ginkgonis TaxID=2695274 RepID=A0A7K1XZW9_9SPHI|nr:redoxin domain-containing protein [Hufsiella ginkgonis]